MSRSLKFPYSPGSGLACVTMLLASFGLGDHPEDELTARLDLDGVAASDLAAVSKRPETHVHLFESYGLAARRHVNGRMNHLADCIDEGRGVVAFLGAKALKTRHCGNVPQRSDQGGISSSCRHTRDRKKACFHDPDPARGGADRSMRKGRCTVWSRRNTFAHVWVCRQGMAASGRGLHSKDARSRSRQRLPPWTL